MPMCGFNQQMLDGLESFHSGLVEHGIVDRSRMKRETKEKIIIRELDDMNRFLKETHNIENEDMRELTEHLTKYALAFYRLIQKVGVENYKEIIQFLNSFYFHMDNKYYTELEGKPKDMKELTLYLNELNYRKRSAHKS